MALTLLCLCFVGCANEADMGLPENGTTGEGLSYVSMRINPEVELVVDIKGAVVAANAINADGETVLAELVLVGMSAEEAGEAFTAAAIELGFIDVAAENASVYILADGENDQTVADLEEKMSDKINKLFDKKGIYGKATKEELADLEALAAEWGVSPKEARMVKRILDLYPEMTAEEILALSFKERVELIKDDCHKNGMTADIREEYKTEIEDLKAEYAEMFELAKRVEELEDMIEDAEEDDDDDDDEDKITLTEEELAALKAEYETAKARLMELRAEYKADVEELKDAKKNDIKLAKEEFKNKAKALREENAKKLEEHFKNFEEKRAEIEEQIKNWREFDKDHDDDEDSEDRDHKNEPVRPEDHPADTEVTTEAVADTEAVA